MKKLTKALLLFPLICVMLVSCSGKPADISTLLGDICRLFPDMPESASVYESNSENEDSLLSEQDACFIYTGQYGELNEWGMVESYAIRLPEEAKVYEIHILKVKNPQDVTAVSKLLCRRADLLADFFASPDQAQDVDYSSYRAEVYLKGQYVFLLATPDNQSVISLIEKSI